MAKTEGNLNRWFKEKWVDIKTGKPCGRSEGEKRKGYPACRPSKRISSKTPKTTKELTSAEKRSRVRQKVALGQPSKGKPRNVKSLKRKRRT